MLKKILGSITPVVLGISLVLAGCLGEIPSDITLTDNIPTIGAPSNVKAVAYKGLNVVTWDPAKDAKSYDVYRRTDRNTTVKNDAGEDVKSIDYENKFLATIANAASLIVKDIVSFDNQLLDKQRYQYIIVANSGQSTNKARVIDDDDVVLNASATSDWIEANIPDRAKEETKKVDAPDAAKITIEGFEGFNYDQAGTMLVSWEKQPGLNYEILYRYGGTGADITPIAYTTANTSYDGEGDGNYLGYYKFPDFTFNSANANDRIEIRAKFPNDYYQPSAVVTKPVPNLALRPQYTVVDGFSADEDSNGLAQVTLTWNVPPDAATPVAPASPYTVWKAERNSSTGTIISDWAKLTGTPSGYQDNRVAKMRLIDTAVTPGKSYIYYLVIDGKNGGKHISDSDTATIRNDARLNETAIGSIVYSIQTDAAGDVKSLEVAWPAVDGVTYKLYQKSITVKNPILTIGGTSIANIEGYTDEGWTEKGTVSSSTPSYKSYSGNTYGFKDITGLTPRQNYAFKVTGTKTVNGKTVTLTPVVKIVDVAPYVTYSDLTISTANIVQNSIFYPANAIVMNISSSAYTRDATVKIYRKIADGAAGTDFALVNTVSGSSVSNGSTEFIDTTGTLGVTYVYKAVLSYGTPAKEFPNANVNNILQNGILQNQASALSGSGFNITQLPPSGGVSSRNYSITISDWGYLNNHNLDGVRLYYTFTYTSTGGTTRTSSGYPTLTASRSADNVSCTITIPNDVPTGNYTINYGLTNRCEDGDSILYYF